DVGNLVSSVGAFIIGASMLIFVYNAIKSWTSGALAGNDPWDGRTLEWTIPSPPPHYNFAQIPIVRARDPFSAEKHPEEGHGHAAPVPIAGGAPDAYEAAGHDGHGEGEAHVHMPDPSIFPPIAAVGLMLPLAGMLLGPPGTSPFPPSWLSVVGVLAMLY